MTVVMSLAISCVLLAVAIPIIKRKSKQLDTRRDIINLLTRCMTDWVDGNIDIESTDKDLIESVLKEMGAERSYFTKYNPHKYFVTWDFFQAEAKRIRDSGDKTDIVSHGGITAKAMYDYNGEFVCMVDNDFLESKKKEQGSREHV